MIIIDKKLKTPVYIQVYESIKKEILSGNLSFHEKLPSIRHLSNQIDVSVKTIQNAYEQLLMEGYIDSKERSGYFVSKVESKFSTPTSSYVEIDEPSYINTGITEDAFEYSVWRRMMNKVLQTIDLSTLSVINGEQELKKEIIHFLHEYRGTVAHYNQVIIGPSSEVLLDRLLQLVPNPIVAYETPGYKNAVKVFEKNAKTIKIPASDEGIKINKLKNANMVYLSPSHQYPFGAIMQISDRYKMIEWAAENGFIIEDDYNSVLRYQGNPIPSLQGLDSDNVVIYMGSFSNLMYPSINISYMILPFKLLKKHEETKMNYNQTVSKVDQLTLAKYMKEGHFERHLRKIRKLYSRKNELIKTQLSHLNVEVVDTNAGTHIVIKVNNSDECIDKAKKENVHLEKIDNEYILFKYRGLENDELLYLLKKIFSKSV